MKKPIRQPEPAKNKTASTRFQQLALHSAVAAALLGGGYSRGVYAGSCTPGPVSTCSGAADDGVDVTQDLSGSALTVTTTAGFGIDTTSTGGSGLHLLGTDGLSFTNADHSKITGAYTGIDAHNYGSGALSITSNGVVTGGESMGISAINYGSDLTLQTAEVTAGDKGIYARNHGNGALSITSSGTVTGSGTFYYVTPMGIAALNHKDGTNLSIQTVAVHGQYTGIFARNEGTGALSITSSGALTGNVYNGVSASNSIYGTDLTLRTTSVTGGMGGIDAFNGGSGALSITSTGAVTSSIYSGIAAHNYRGTNLSLQTAAVTGGYTGIYARNRGNGSLSITSNGAVTATESHGLGISASNYGTDLTLNTTRVESAGNAIVARNEGTGALSITSTGDVTGGGNGIHALSAGTELTLTTAAVAAGDTGIYAWNFGSGSSTITSGGVVTGGHQGISALHSGNSGALTITTHAAVTGGLNGIYAQNLGGSAINISSHEAVTATTNAGIKANNEGANLTLQATSVTGASGISARNNEGSLSITSSGTVTGTSRYGISAVNSGSDLTLQTKTVTAESDGIYTRNNGDGALSITSSGVVTGSQGSGIIAENFGTSLTLETAAVTGADSAVEARNYGSGALTITASDVVTSTTGRGIYAENAGTNLTLQTAAVTGDSLGIRAHNYGSGALSITASDAVVGDRNWGIIAINTGTDLTVQTEAVTGGRFGILISHEGEGRLSITTDGVVTGDSENALRLSGFATGTIEGSITNNGGLVSNQDAAVVMTRGSRFGGEFNNNAAITGGNGTAFDASSTTLGIVLNQSAGTITGDVLLGSGDDRVTITGGVINGRIIGQGFGTVAIDVGADNHFSANAVVNVADYLIQSGSVHQMADFSTAAATTTVASGATLSFSSLITGGGALVSNGELEFVLSPGSNGELIQMGTVTLNNGSTISVDTDGFIPAVNESIQLISATGIIDNGVVVSTDIPASFLYDYQALISADSLSVVTTVTDLGTVSPLKNPSAFGSSMTDFVSGGGDNAVVELLAGLDSGDVEGFEQIADVFSPSVSGAVSAGAREANDSTWRLINERFVGSDATLHISEPPNGVWLQGYGGTTDQDVIDHVDGFDADTSGVAVGYDLDLAQWRVGAAFSAGETNIDNDRFASDRIDIESEQFIVYGGFRQDQWFANATASAAALDYDFKRNNMIAGEGPIKSDTDGDLLGLSVSGGYQYAVADNIVLTPQLSVRYTALDVDDYSEDGGLDLRVEYDSIDTLTSELGVSAAARYTAGDWQLAPTARLAWVHEYLGENEQLTARYADQSYIQQGFDPDEDFASVGLGVETSNQHGVSISIDYRGTFGSDYSSNQGWLNLRYEF